MKLTKHLLVILLLFIIAGLGYVIDQPVQQTISWLQTSIPVTLYYGAEDASGVHPVVQWMAPDEADISGRLQALIDGPADDHVYRSIPERTALHSALVKDNIAILDFNRALVDNHSGGATGEMITVYSIVNTVTEMDGVDQVVFLVDGSQIETLVGHLDLRYPIERDETFITIDQTHQ